MNSSPIVSLASRPHYDACARRLVGYGRDCFLTPASRPGPTGTPPHPEEEELLVGKEAYLLRMVDELKTELGGRACAVGVGHSQRWDPRLHGLGRCACYNPVRVFDPRSYST